MCRRYTGMGDVGRGNPLFPGKRRGALEGSDETMGSVIAETDRLLLRALVADDIEPLLGVLGHPQVMRFSLKGPLSREEVSAWLKPRIRASSEGQPSQYAVVRKRDEAFLGFSGFIPFADPDGDADYELGFRFHPFCWGDGVATESGRAVISYGFDCLGLESVAAVVEEANAASVRVLEKLAMRYLKDMRYHDIPVRRYVVWKQQIQGATGRNGT